MWCVHDCGSNDTRHDLTGFLQLADIGNTVTASSVLTSAAKVVWVSLTVITQIEPL